MQNKRAQVTLFIILAIFLFAIIFILTVFYFPTMKEYFGIGQNSGSLEGIKSNLDSCLENVSIGALDLYGFDTEFIDAYITNNLPICFDKFLYTLSKKYQVKSDLKEIKVDADANNIFISANYPITLSKEDSSIILGSFNFNVHKKETLALITDERCYLLENKKFY